MEHQHAVRAKPAPSDRDRRAEERLEATPSLLAESQELSALKEQLQEELCQLQEQLDSLEMSRSRALAQSEAVFPAVGREVKPPPTNMRHFHDGDLEDRSTQYGHGGSSIMSTMTPAPRCRPTPKPRVKTLC